MFDEGVKPHHLFIPILILFFGAWVATWAGWTFPGYALMGVGILYSVSLPAVLVMYAKRDLFDAKRRYLNECSGADPAMIDLLGLKYPTLELQMSGDARVFVRGSDVELKYFKLFMENSDPTFICPVSRWGDKTQARKQWYKWKLYLEQERAILPDRTRVTETFRWRSPGDYRRFMAYKTLRTPRELIPVDEPVPDGTRPLPDTPEDYNIEEQV